MSLLSPRHSANHHQAAKGSIPEKANRVLHVLLVVMSLIVLKVWYLSVVQHHDKLEEVRKPRQRVVFEAAERGTIRDRFNIPLAINRVNYHAAIVYAQIQSIPSVGWERDEKGRRVKKRLRKEHVSKLSQLLADELDMDLERVEDLIYSKSAFYYQRPFVIKDNITEKQYFRLKMLEKDFEGLQMLRVPKRCYPWESVGGTVIGYMGAINKEEYEGFMREKKELGQYLRFWESGDTPTPQPEFVNMESLRRRYQELSERAYSLTDYVGKTGIEGRYEEHLRGFQGKRTYYSDAKGNFLRELPGAQSPLPGQRVMLSLSAELQNFAEQILAENEAVRDGRSTKLNRTSWTRTTLKQPWIKGGAIVAMEPFTGEVLALATYPRFNPNDFILSGDTEVNRSKRDNILRWFETETYIQDIWEGRRPLEREYFKGAAFRLENLPLSWETFIHFILPENNVVREKLATYSHLQDAIDFQNHLNELLALFEDMRPIEIINSLYNTEPHVLHNNTTSQFLLEEDICFNQPIIDTLKNQLQPYLQGLDSNYDKLLLADLYRLSVNGDLFSPELKEQVGGISLSTYHEQTNAFVHLDGVVKSMTKELFHEIDFKHWRQKEGKNFLKKKRAQERAEGRWAKPYVDLFDAKERQLFADFWKERRSDLISAFILGSKVQDPYTEHFSKWAQELIQGAHSAAEWHKDYLAIKKAITSLEPKLALEYLQTFRGFSELTRPLLGRYRQLRRQGPEQLEKHLAAAFYPLNGYGFARSFAFQQSAPQGSLFKLVTAYEALRQRFDKLQNEGTYRKDKLNPLEIVDHVYQEGKSWYVGNWISGEPIPRNYKGGVLPRSYKRNLGKMDLTRALETSGNPYFSLLAGDCIADPDDLVRAAENFGYAKKTDIDLNGEIAGELPSDLRLNRTGLYSFAIGHHTLIATPLQAAVMLSSIANGGQILQPKLVKLFAGGTPVRRDDATLWNKEAAFCDDLKLAGILFPLFTAAEDRPGQNLICPVETKTVRQVAMPQDVREMLIDGMHKGVASSQADGGGSLTWVYRNCPKPIRDFIEFKDQLIGKTSTAEAVENVDLDRKFGTGVYNHLWFGGFSYNKEENSSTETQVIKDKLGRPELVIVVYLRYGGYGKEATPLAAQMAKKWREIQKSHTPSVE